jgi:hypothetical protein
MGTIMFVLFFASLALSHSWVEQLSVVGPSGLLQAQTGFPRGNGTSNGLLLYVCFDN